MNIFEKELTRRKFLKWQAYSLGVVLWQPDWQQNEEEAIEAYRRWQSNWKLRYVPEINGEIRRVNRDWDTYFDDSEVPPPGLGEGAVTYYGPAATAVDQVMIQGQEYLRVDGEDLTIEKQRVVEIMEALLDSNLADIEISDGRNSQAFGDEFYRVLNEMGYQAVVATKYGGNIGEVYHLEVRDHVGRAWQGGVIRQGRQVPIRGIVLDVATARTFYSKRGLYYPHEEFVDASGRPIDLAWFADMSEEIMREFKLPLAHPDSQERHVVTIRWSKEDLTGTEVIYPEYEEEAIPVEADYVNLAGEVRRGLDNGEVREAILSWRQGRVVDEAVLDGDSFSGTLTGGEMVQRILSETGVVGMRELDPNGFYRQITGREPYTDYGFPVSKPAINFLLQAWQRNGLITLGIDTVNQQVDLCQMPVGFSVAESIAGVYGSEQMVELGLYYREGGNTVMVWVNSDYIFRERILTPNDWTKGGWLVDEEGEEDWSRRIMWYG